MLPIGLSLRFAFLIRYGHVPGMQSLLRVLIKPALVIGEGFQAFSVLIVVHGRQHTSGAAVQIKTGHCRFQNRPVGIKTGQYRISEKNILRT